MAREHAAFNALATLPSSVSELVEVVVPAKTRRRRASAALIMAHAEAETDAATHESSVHHDDEGATASAVSGTHRRVTRKAPKKRRSKAKKKYSFGTKISPSSSASSSSPASGRSGETTPTMTMTAQTPPPRAAPSRRLSARRAKSPSKMGGAIDEGPGSALKLLEERGEQSPPSAKHERSVVGGDDVNAPRSASLPSQFPSPAAAAAAFSKAGKERGDARRNKARRSLPATDPFDDGRSASPARAFSEAGKQHAAKQHNDARRSHPVTTSFDDGWSETPAQSRDERRGAMETKADPRVGMQSPSAAIAPSFAAAVEDVAATSLSSRSSLAPPLSSASSTSSSQGTAGVDSGLERGEAEHRVQLAAAISGDDAATSASPPAVDFTRYHHARMFATDEEELQLEHARAGAPAPSPRSPDRKIQQQQRKRNNGSSATSRSIYDDVIVSPPKGLDSPDSMDGSCSPTSTRGDWTKEQLAAETEMLRREERAVQAALVDAQGRERLTKARLRKAQLENEQRGQSLRSGDRRKTKSNADSLSLMLQRRAAASPARADARAATDVADDITVGARTGAEDLARYRRVSDAAGDEGFARADAEARLWIVGGGTTAGTEAAVDRSQRTDDEDDGFARADAEARRWSTLAVANGGAGSGSLGRESTRGAVPASVSESSATITPDRALATRGSFSASSSGGKRSYARVGSARKSTAAQRGSSSRGVNRAVRTPPQRPVAKEADGRRRRHGDGSSTSHRRGTYFGTYQHGAADARTASRRSPERSPERIPERSPERSVAAPASSRSFGFDALEAAVRRAAESAPSRNSAAEDAERRSAQEELLHAAMGGAAAAKLERLTAPLLARSPRLSTDAEVAIVAGSFSS